MAHNSHAAGTPSPFFAGLRAVGSGDLAGAEAQLQMLLRQTSNPNRVTLAHTLLTGIFEAGEVARHGWTD